ncbi:hypothetical protein DERF_013541 [Dermatophagoides farinae]|uniref:Uncharacterized protein n=1 Tax=Dermatophagoides farinae TaxID=6954 RepID=A0A922KWK7_DERFA|nr:hypothetical protein DERF_013541 [Dermatophagoides farinae]
MYRTSKNKKKCESFRLLKYIPAAAISCIDYISDAHYQISVIHRCLDIQKRKTKLNNSIA